MKSTLGYTYIKLISSWVLFVLTLIFCTSAQTTPSETEGAQSPQPDVQGVHDLVVMIESDAGIGAGIIFGQKNNSVFIATANHVVRQGPKESQNVRVQFKTSPGKWFPATIAKDYNAHRDIDLAVLRIEDFENHGTDFCALPLGRLAHSEKLQRGAQRSPVLLHH